MLTLSNFFSVKRFKKHTHTKWLVELCGVSEGDHSSD